MRLLVCLALVCSCSQNDEKPVERRIEPTAPAPASHAPAAAPPKAGVSQKLFADDVPAGTLPLSIAIETIGGVSTILIPRGTKLPVSITEVFSTALDDQSSVEVHILQGERPLAVNNRSLGKFQLRGIPPAPRGVPQIEVTFTLLASGVLEVTARDLATNAMKEIVIDGAASTLDKAAVDKMLAEMKGHHDEDERTRVWTDTRIKLEGLAHESKRLLATVGDKLSAKMRKRWADELARAELALAANTKPGDPKLLVVAHEALQKTMHAGSEELYKNAK